VRCAKRAHPARHLRSVNTECCVLNRAICRVGTKLIVGAQGLLFAGRMATVSIWRRGARTCVLVIGGANNRPAYRLRIVHGAEVLRDETMKSADHALLTAEIWHTMERESRYGAVPPV
jgi:hypothetical protein